MFLRNLFKKTPPPEPVTEKFNLNTLHKRVEELKQKELEQIKPGIDKVMNEIIESKKIILNDLKKLAEARQSEEIHPKLLKSANEARKLLIEKINRGLSNIGRYSELSIEALNIVNRNLAKSVNLTTDAVMIHGRYVRAVFEPEFATLQYNLRRLHDVAKMTNEKINAAINKMVRLNSLSSEINSLTNMVSSSEKIRDEVEKLKVLAKKIENHVEDEKRKLEHLVAGEEFKRASDAEQERERVGSEIANLEEAVKNMFSDVNRGLRKFENLLSSGKLCTDREKMKILEVCINNPHEILSSDEKISATEKLLHEVTKFLEEGKIEIEDRKRRKKLESMRKLPTKLWELKHRLDVLKDRLKTLQLNKDHSIELQISGLKQSIAEQKSKLDQVKTSIEELKRKLEIVEKEMEEKRANIEKLAEEILGANVKLTF
ncbi:MAG: hypothetical protein DRN83_02650 [Hadesarchaea archaeon]|nr:MAG: hypothetical protein DRN83_02650 [Hadesarchaea archaeon]